jgi:hypothetical protein
MEECTHAPALFSVPCVRALGGVRGGVGRILMRQSADRWCCSYAPASITICTCAHALSKQMRAQPSHPPTHEGAHVASQGAEVDTSTPHTLRFKSHPHRCIGCASHTVIIPFSMGCHTLLQVSGALGARNVEATSLTWCHRLFDGR